MTLKLRIGTLAAAAVIGVAAGTGGFTFVYGQGASYLTNDPTACANCHIMNEQFDAWVRSSHRSVATCNDCHAPHDIVGKYLTKARNGWAHSVAFTTGDFPERIRIKPRNLEVTEGACRYCHGDMAAVVDGPGRAEPSSCVSCHSEVGHPDGAPLLSSPATSGHRGDQ